MCENALALYTRICCLNAMIASAPMLEFENAQQAVFGAPRGESGRTQGLWETKPNSNK